MSRSLLERETETAAVEALLTAARGGSIDDVQWADPQSLGFLVYLARRLDEVPTALLAMVREGEPGDPAAALRSEAAELSLSPPDPPARLSHHEPRLRREADRRPRPRHGDRIRLRVAFRDGAAVEDAGARLQRRVAERLAKLGIAEPRGAVEPCPALERAPGGKLRTVVATTASSSTA